MILEALLKNTLSSDFETLRQIIIFMIIGALITVYLTTITQVAAAKILKISSEESLGSSFSFNPLKQLNFFNLFSIIVFVLFGFSWTIAPKNIESRLKNIIIAVSAIVSGFIIAILCIALYSFVEIAFINSILISIATAAVAYSITNLLPIPGLMGGNIIANILPENIMNKFLSFKKYSIFIIIMLIILAARSGIASLIISNTINTIQQLFV